MTAADVLLAAARVIRDRGWYQGGFVDPTRPDDGPVCLDGALFVAAGGACDAFDAAVWAAARSALRLSAGLTGDGALQRWNDQPGRTADQVILALEIAALELELGMAGQLALEGRPSCL
jgi:hypothetical protein